VANALPPLLADIQTIVADLKTQDDGAAKVAALADGIEQLAATVKLAAQEMEDAK
jgi:hypothetical protein